MVALPHRDMTRPGAAAVRVAVVDDSVVVRGLLSKWLSEAHHIEVVGTYRSGREIIDALPGAAPRVILLDLDMPDMDGLTALPLILARSPQSRVIVVSSLSVHGAELTMRSLMKGATDYLPKPSNHREVSTSNDFRQALIAKVLAVGGVRVRPAAAAPSASPAPPPRPAPAVRPSSAGGVPSALAALTRGSAVSTGSPASASARVSPVARAPASPSAVSPAASTSAQSFSPAAPATMRPAAPERTSGGVVLRPLERNRPKAVVIGASTGGPQALIAMLARMASGISRVPVVIAQHMPPIFGPIFASHLKQHAGLPAVEAVDGKPLAPGTIYLAPGGCHTVVRRKPDGQYVMAILPSEARGPWRPSIDLLFSSAAETYGGEALAIAMTGMGRDGTEGATHLARRNANVIVQDEATSVVWGIPGSIAEAGLANAMLSPEKLGDLAVSLLEGNAP